MSHDLPTGPPSMRPLSTVEAACLVRGSEGQDAEASWFLGLLDLIARGVVGVSIPPDSGLDEDTGPYLRAGTRPVTTADGPALYSLTVGTASLLGDARHARKDVDGVAWVSLARWCRDATVVGGDARRWQRDVVLPALGELRLLSGVNRAKGARGLLRNVGATTSPIARTPAGDTLVSAWTLPALGHRSGQRWWQDVGHDAAILDEWLALLDSPWVGGAELVLPPREALVALWSVFVFQRLPPENWGGVAPSSGGS